MMRQSTAANAAEPAAPLTPESRSTEFVAVTGGAETSSAEVLLTTAYALMWIAVFVFIFLTWKKQNQIAAKLGELDQKLRAAQPKA
jgi:hypothetical protein